MSWESQSIDWLAAALVRPFVLVAAAWLILRVMRVRHPASRHAVWAAVLIGMLMLPVVNVIAPHWSLPVLSGIRETAPTILEDLPSNVAMAPRGPIAESSTSGKRPFAWPEAETAILWCYFAGLLAMVTYRAVGWALLRRVLSRSTPLRARRLRESADVLIPVAVGVLRPAVILPAGWRGWNSSTCGAPCWLTNSRIFAGMMRWWRRSPGWLRPYFGFILWLGGFREGFRILRSSRAMRRRWSESAIRPDIRESCWPSPGS